MNISVSVRGEREVLAVLSKLTPAIEKELVNAVNTSALNIQNGARQRLTDNNNVVTGLLRAKTAIKKFNKGMAASIGPRVIYGIFVEYGTRPHWPPLEPILEWVRARGRGAMSAVSGRFSIKTKRRLGSKTVREREDMAAARAIQYKISIKGTKAHPFLFPSYEQERPHFIEQIKEKVLKGIKKAV